METSGIMFKKENLASFSLIDAPGKYTLKVLSDVSEKNLFTDEKGRQRYIVGLRAIEAGKLPQLREVFTEDIAEVGIEQTNGLFLTASIWKKNAEDQPKLPMKGEEVEVNIGYVKDREDQDVLRVTNIHVLPAKKAAAFSLASLTVAETEPSGAIAQ